MAHSEIYYKADTYQESQPGNEDEEEWYTGPSKAERLPSMNQGSIRNMEQMIKVMKARSSIIKFTEKEIPGIQNMTQREISDLVYQQLKKASPFSTLILPDRHIILHQIFIRFPLTIKGSSGTILEVVNGNFICDFRVFITKFFKGILPKHHQDFRCILSEVNLVFKFDPIRIFERLKEAASKLNFNRDNVSYSDSCLQYFKVNRNVMMLPLLVVENCTAIDVNDCYFRSIKRQS